MDSKKQAPRGITVRGNSLGIAFTYQGKQCRETLKLPPTANNLKYATNLLAGIKAEIARGTFNYIETFPSSSTAKASYAGIPTLEMLVDDWRATQARALEVSTVRGYEFSFKNHLLPAWGKTKITDITPAKIAKWVSQSTQKAKTIRNHLAPLRVIFNDAVIKGYIDRSPMEYIQVHKLVPKEQASSDYVVDPFNPTEVAQILSAAKGQYKNLWQFAFSTGLRSSELYALEWGDINFTEGYVHVCRADVDGVVKSTKTKSGVRDVFLTEQAIEALKAQKQYTFLANGRIFDLSNPKVWAKHWAILLRKAEVDHRNPYQTRHTFASALVQSGESLHWVAKQLGHKSIEMVLRVYVKWIPKDRRSDPPRGSWLAPEQSARQS